MEKSMMVDISVVIVNYNVKDLILTCLETLYAFHPDAFNMEVIVVDNHSKDDSIEAIRKNFPGVILIENHYNAGFPAANNQAFRIARGRYLFMLNPDTEFFDSSLSMLYQKLESTSTYDFIGPKLLNTDGSLQPSFWRFPTLRYLFFETLYLSRFIPDKYYLDQNFEEAFEADSFSGAAILFRREVLERIGYLDESLFWIEEIDYCFRAKAAGMQLLYYPKATIIHHIGQSAKKNYNIAICHQVVNKIKFFKKYHPGIQWFGVVCLSLIHVLAKLFVFTILSPFKRMYYLKAKAYLYTLPRVFNPPTKMPGS